MLKIIFLEIILLSCAKSFDSYGLDTNLYKNSQWYETISVCNFIK